MTKLGVLISGRGSHLKNMMDRCSRGEISASVAVVISNNPDAPGLRFPREAGIETVVLSHKHFTARVEYDTAIVEHLKRCGVELICLAGFMRLLSPVLIRAFPQRIMNVHPSLLPAFPGLHAQKQAIEYGAKITGVTVHFVDEGLDSGPVILQRTVEVRPEDTEESLADHLLPVEHQAYADAVRLFCENRLKIEGRKVLIL